jgi:hypothetical protein
MYWMSWACPKIPQLDLKHLSLLYSRPHSCLLQQVGPPEGQRYQRRRHVPSLLLRHQHRLEAQRLFGLQRFQL